MWLHFSLIRSFVCQTYYLITSSIWNIKISFLGGCTAGCRRAVVCAELFWHETNCASPRPEPDSQLGSCYRKGLGRWALQIMRKYNCTTAIVICLSIHPHMWETSYSSVSAMSQLNLLSRTWASFPSIPSTEITNRYMFFPLLMTVLTTLIIFSLLSPSEKADHWLLVVSLIVGVPEYDINDHKYFMKCQIKNNCSDYILFHWLLRFYEKRFSKCTYKNCSYNIFLIEGTYGLYYQFCLFFIIGYIIF